MFRNIVSRLSFSPALVGQLSFYAKRLKKEQTTRRLGLIFTALALVVQSLVVFQAPEPANAANNNDFVYGGLGQGSNRSLNNFLNPYDKNSGYLQDIMNSFGITRAEIASASYGSFKTGGHYSWGRHARTIDAGSMKVTNASGAQVATVYGRPMAKLYNSSSTTIYGYIGRSASVGWFAIMQDCGNLVTEYIPPPKPEPKDIVVCRLSDNKIITIKENEFDSTKHSKNKKDCEPKTSPGVLELSKLARNVTQGNLDATKQAARANDRIVYTLTIRNGGGSAKEATFVDNIEDVLEYATLVDNGGGVFDEKTKTLTWPSIMIDAAKAESRTYTVKLLSTIPVTPVGQSDRTSYDCEMDNVFGNGVQVPVACTTPKVVEEIVTELPKTGPGENMAFAFIVLSVITYFYYRSKQMNKEVRLIRRDLNAGTL